MASTKQVKTKIKSVKNLQKIIKALEVVSTVKLQKLKEMMMAYREVILSFIAILRIIQKEVNVFDFDQITWNPDGKILLLVVTSDRGLCGAINSRIFRTIEENYGRYKDKVEIFVVGKKGMEYFVRNGRKVVGSVNVTDKVESVELKPILAYIKKALLDKSYSKIKVYFNFFKNTMSQVLTGFKLYPLNEESFSEFLENIGVQEQELEDIENKHLMVEPNLEEFKFEFLNLIIRNIVYSAVLNNKTTEHAARMLAMKNAKDNCGDLLVDLNLLYNKTRQSKITQEISEIVSAKIAIE